MNTKQVMQQALDFITGFSVRNLNPHDLVMNTNADNLRQAIQGYEQAEKQEPVAWMNKQGALATLYGKKHGHHTDGFNIPLYTHPQRELSDKPKEPLNP